MPFIITGNGPSGFYSATRSSPASAIVLAMKWAEHGVQGVQITPPDQEARCFTDFRAQHYRKLLAVVQRRRSRFRPT